MFIEENYTQYDHSMGAYCKLSIVLSGIYFAPNSCNFIRHYYNSNVRHPRFVLYNSKQLGMLTLNVEHKYICFYYKEFTTTCFGPICGPSSGCG